MAAMSVRRARVLIARPATVPASRITAEHLSVEEVSTMNELIAAMSLRRPAVLLLSMQFVGLTEFGGIRKLRRLSPSTRIIVVSDAANDREELDVLRLGAKGYCDTNDANVLLKMIEKVQQGEIWAGRKTIGSLLEEFYGATAPPREMLGDGDDDESVSVSLSDSKMDRLTDREREILHLLADGASNKEIAIALNVTVATIKAHLTKMFRKLDQPDRLHLALYAAARRRVSH